MDDMLDRLGQTIKSALGASITGYEAARGELTVTARLPDLIKVATASSGSAARLGPNLGPKLRNTGENTATLDAPAVSGVLRQCDALPSGRRGEFGKEACSHPLRIGDARGLRPQEVSDR
jgi:hypothetical protein